MSGRGRSGRFTRLLPDGYSTVHDHFPIAIRPYTSSVPDPLDLYPSYFRSLCTTPTERMLGQTTFLLLVTVAWAADVDGGWNSWLQWSTCSVSCGHGYHVRSRICDNPEQEGNGTQCIGSDYETKGCDMKHCP
ncbi:hypothetical protein DPMN_117587, partial [Dreissena polymorpha]